MDKKSLLGYVMIFVVVVGWMMWQQANTPPPKPETKTETSLDSLKIDSTITATEEINEIDNDISIPSDSSNRISKYGPVFSKFSEGNEKIITIENDVVIAKLSNKGAALKKWVLKDFKKWDGEQSDLIWNDEGEAYLTFTTFSGNRIDTRELYFDIDNLNETNIKLQGDDSISFEMTLNIANGKFLKRVFTFYGDKYIYNTKVVTQNLEEIIPPNRGYNFVWSDGIRYQEGNSVDESSDAHAVAQLNGSLAELDADKDQPVESKETGVIDFIGMKTKYFGLAIIPQPWQSFDGTVDLYGWKTNVRSNGVVERYDVSLRVPIKQGLDERSYDLYIGPLDYGIVKDYGIEAMVNLGWKYGIRQISVYFMRPILVFIHEYVPNYGISIILFSILIKLMLYPLTIQQMRNAQKMKLLAPEMAKLKDKYKDDQMKQQQETMALYSQYGINPAGGCLPMMLQMPILYALWTLLRNSIDLRQQPFAFWITDLSIPDKIIDFGFPILGLTHISGLALAMGITMFFQQKLTISDPRQKSLVYMMPVMFTLMFSYFPAGLNLYYFMFNLLSILQQLYINNFAKNRPTLETLKRTPKKEGWLQKKMREAQEISAQNSGGASHQKKKTPYQKGNKQSPKKRK